MTETKTVRVDPHHGILVVNFSPAVTVDEAERAMCAIQRELASARIEGRTAALFLGTEGRAEYHAPIPSQREFARIVACAATNSCPECPGFATPEELTMQGCCNKCLGATE